MNVKLMASFFGRSSDSERLRPPLNLAAMGTITNRTCDQITFTKNDPKYDSHVNLTKIFFLIEIKGAVVTHLDVHNFCSIISFVHTSFWKG